MSTKREQLGVCGLDETTGAGHGTVPHAQRSTCREWEPIATPEQLWAEISRLRAAVVTLEEDEEGERRELELHATITALTTKLAAAEARVAQLEAALDARNAFLREVEADNDAEPWDQADEERRLTLALEALQSDDLLTAATLLYATQPAIAREFLRRKCQIRTVFGTDLAEEHP